MRKELAVGGDGGYGGAGSRREIDNIGPTTPLTAQ